LPTSPHGANSRSRRFTRRHRPARWLAVLAAAVLVLGGGAYIAKSYFSNLNNTFAVTKVNQRYHKFQFQHRITILLLGSSLQTAANHTLITAKNARNRTDTMILVSIDPKTHQVGVLSIPRDTRVDLPGIGMTKIAEASYEGGLSETVRVVENTFHIPVDYYAYLSLFQFPKLINDMGGLTVDVPQNEVYQPGGKLGIDLKAGVQHLNGWQVLAFTRFRQTAEGDISRIQQQQEVLADMAHQLLQPKYLPMIPTLVSDFSRLCTTNMTPAQMLSLALFAKQVNLSTIRYGTIPGYGSVHYDPILKMPLDDWTYDPKLADVVIQNVLLANPLTPAERHALTFFVASGTDSLAPARALAQRLIDEGYSVAGVGWANRHNHRRSLILNTTGDKWLDGSLEHMLGPSVVTFTPYHTTPWDFKITVGSDWAGGTAGSQ